ncbi:hypothetical protein BDV23DRAFT_190138 [Aspergillus alliaceus]|uniref:Glycosyl transferase CAP10 domain-containing protein n=1 Tax=Petromyces alliaceus TaxID=209559 RepID=A0A5N7BWY5_PETAA|nr:hypothetical protein BDV23DRAFT_190138 [Aspergillus alliaceus]
MLPTRSRSVLWIFSSVSLIPFLANTLMIHNAQTSVIRSGLHPVESLIHNAKMGFDAWYKFAKLRQPPIVDEFDMIYEVVAPFLQLNGQDIHDIMNGIQVMSNSEQWFCIFSGQQAKTHCSHADRTFDRHIQRLLNQLLENLGSGLPDIRLLVNHLDEPSVLIPPRLLEKDGLRTKHFNLKNVEVTVPILSTGSLSTMGGFLYPSPAYNETEFRYLDAVIEREKKQNNLYWAGSTTGVLLFVQLAQNLEHCQCSYLQGYDGVISQAKSSFLDSQLFNVTFTRIFQCKRRYCRDQYAHFNIMSWADKDQALYGCYNKLPASKSVPLKQTLLREWHVERIRERVHYIPVSPGMEELPEIILYLTSTETGKKRAQEIAKQGRDRFSKAFCDVDLSIYVYRILLELSRQKI